MFISSVVCVSLQGRTEMGSQARAIQRASYRISSSLGRARIVFSIVFLAAVALFLDEATSLTLSLVAFWAIFIAIWSLGLPQFLSGLTLRRPESVRIVGTIDRIDSPGIVRVALTTDDNWKWDAGKPLIVHMRDHSVRWGVPLFSEDCNDGRWGTLMLAGAAEGYSGAEAGTIQCPVDGEQVPTSADLLKAVTGVENPNLVGFVTDGSTVAVLRLEALPDSGLRLAGPSWLARS